jgi:hypothetical protein
MKFYKVSRQLVICWVIVSALLFCTSIFSAVRYNNETKLVAQATNLIERLTMDILVCKGIAPETPQQSNEGTI